MEALGEEATEVTIRVGAMGNKSRALSILDGIKSNL